MRMRYQASVERSFDATHALQLPDDSFEPVHEHRWVVTVTVESHGLDEIDTVMDFHDLERMIDGVIGPWDGGDLNACEPFAQDGDGGKKLAINPSAERVVEVIAKGVLAQLEREVPAVKLRSVEVTEAPGCKARLCLD